MGTQVRDAMVEALSKAGAEKFVTAEKLAEKAGVEVSSAAAALALLARKGIAKRQRVGKAFEYAAGARIATGLKYVGRKFPFHKNGHSGEAVPASGGMAGIVIKLNEQAHAITLAEAKQLFGELKALFG